MERINAWKTYSQAQLTQLEQISQAYRHYLDHGKTERECVRQTVAEAEQRGFSDLNQRICQGKPLQPGEKLYSNCMGKALLLFVIGGQPLEQGMNIVGAHIDSPRMDVKQNPLYEDGDLAYLDTHYYGGIKKYQWVTIPLALHGVVVKKDGTLVDITVGEAAEDPVVGISDLLVHLAGQQMDKKAAVAIEGEELNVIVGGKPLADTEKEPVKATILQLLKERYDIEEEDFLSAEIEVVPAGAAREFGLDRSMVMGYGHDDRVCAFAAIQAIFSQKSVPERTCCCVLSDKEEIGSVGATGMQARFFENAVAELLALSGEPRELILRRALANCRMLSCDVSAGFDPNFASAFEKNNSAYLGRGVCFNKYTGSRGKSGSNDANPEFIAHLRAVLDAEGVNYQTAELGKVDQGGGGTIAYICALYGMNVIDSGVAVLSMHAPWEIINKADLYEAVRCYGAFMEKA